MVKPMQHHKQKDTLPLITVAMPVYNAGKYLRLAVLSIVRQTFTDWELLIIDDGSTDNAFQNMADITDSRIRILRDGLNKGLAIRLNEAVDLARGQYLARMDADDVSYPERFALQIEAMQKNPHLDVVAVRAITIDENNAATGLFPHALSHDEICARPWRGFNFPHPTWFGRIEWFHKHRYTVPGPYFCEDQELLLRSYRESRFSTLDDIQFAYRIRSNVNWQKLARTRRTVFAAQLRYFASLNLWHLAFLAAVAFIAKMVSDLLQRSVRGDFQPGRGAVNNAVSIEWQKILGDLSTGTSAP